MTESKRQQVRRLFLEVAELSDAERASALERACKGDAELRAEVEALLHAEQAAGRFLSSPTNRGAAHAVVSAKAPDGEGAGAQIGRYKLLEQIGEGGMGTIWMAEQREPVKRRVALKIIKLGMDTKQVIARFEAERQALAMMDHPHIAKVLDAGATETGRPYFVMEYIKGIPILEYCDKERLDTKARLALFTSVCHAIQHAHQKGIIHRDIKPSNVLVTMHDGVPVTKVIDFGIAKATNSELTTKTLFTEHRQMIGTPAYMSPEQAEMSGLDIDTRSDVYSLGVLLYELLTGSTPFDTQKLLESGYAEMLRAIREDEPHKPSTRISTLGDTGTRTAQQRRVELKKLSLILRGDLDWIVMKCIEKDRTRRYDTANGLAADIGRHLRDEPITAGAPSAAYKLHKFVKRNRGQVIAASAMMTALLVAIVGTSWGLVENSRARSARVQRELLDEQRTVAENARLGRNAEAVTALLEQCEESLRSGDAAKARVALDAARKRSAEGGAEKDAERVSRRGADLELLVALDAIDQFRWTWTNDDYAPVGVAAKRMRAPLLKFGADPEASSVEDALVVVNASAVRERIVAALDWQLWSRHSEAVRALLRRLDADPFRNEIRDSNLAQDSSKFTELTNRPEALEQPPAFAAFVGEFNQVEAGRQLELLHAAVLRRPRDMNVLMALQRNCIKDLPEHLRWSQAAAAANPNSVAAMGNLGVALKMSGRLEEAIACYHRAIELDPKSAAAYLNLGNALELSGHYEEALVNQRKAIDLAPAEFETYCCMGNTLGRHGRTAEALDCFKKSIELEPNHADSRYGMGVVMAEQGRWPEAMDAYEKAIELDPKFAEPYANMGVALRNQGRLDEAVGWFQKSLELDPKNAKTLTNLGGVLAGLGRYDEGIALGKQAIESDPKYAEAYYNLGTTYLVDGSFEDAVVTLRKAIDLDPSRADPHCNLAQALQRLGKFKEALPEFERCHELGSAQPGWKYPSADWIRDVKAEIAKSERLLPKLPALLEGKYEPVDDSERVELAFLCQEKKLNHAATRLFTAALAADPALGEPGGKLVRYNAACVALLSAAGQGEDSADLADDERVRLRKQALDWLRADLSVATKRIASIETRADSWARWFCTYSRTNADLISIREPAELAKLPADEQAAFTQLWADMAALLETARAPSPQAGDVEASPQPAVLDVDDFELAKRLGEQGRAQLARKDFAEAEATQRKLLEVNERLYGGDHRETAQGLENLAVVLRDSGRPADAEPFALRALEMYQRLIPGDSGEVALASFILGSTREQSGRVAEAVQPYEMALAMNRRRLPKTNWDVLAAMTTMGRVYYSIGKFDKAVALYEEALKVEESTFGREHLQTLMTIGNIGANYRMQGRVAEALPLLEEAWSHSKQYPELRFVDTHLFSAYVQTANAAKEGSTAKALALFDEILTDTRATLKNGSPELASKLTTFGMGLNDLKAWDTCEPLLREALEIREKSQPDAWTTFNTKSVLGGALAGQKKLAEAESMLLAGYRGMKEREASIPPQGATRIPEALERLVKFYEAQGNASEAAKWRSELEAARATTSKPSTNGGK